MALERLETLGFEDPERVFASYPHELSGGMNQRVIIAAASILDPKLLILDEPTKGLDPKAIDAVLSETQALRDRVGTGILIITHDLEIAEKTATHTGVIYAGELVEYAAAADFFGAPLHPYSQALIGSLPRNGFHPIPGNPGSKAQKGCSFYPRCLHAAQVCATEAPADRAINGRRVRCHRCS